jgi:uncharacterized protein YerC
MPRVSKTRRLSQLEENVFLDDLWRAIGSLKNKKEVRGFFNHFLTAEEKLMLAKRFQIAMALLLGWSWNKINNYAKVTHMTVGKTKKRAVGAPVLTRVAKRIINFKKKAWEERFQKSWTSDKAENRLLGVGGLKLERPRRGAGS